MSAEVAGHSRPRWYLLALDVVVVTVFAATGRRTHGEANPFVGVLDTAWPFLLGMVAGWVVAYYNWDRRVPVHVPAGVAIWVCAIAIGMLVRRIMGEGTALAFVIVATLFVGAGLIGWRLIRTLVLRRG